MGTTEKIHKHIQLRRRYFWGMAIGWTVVVVASLLLNLWQVRQDLEEAARIQARAAYEKDVVYRRWNIGHGGIYVPVTEETPPNPYLVDIPERDITTLSGKKLTLVNPAYMTRQVHESQQQEFGILGHITSLDPIRPENVADEWETEALQAFESGATEISSIEVIQGQGYMRLMRPLINEESCMNCHAAHGYQVGDIHGGISVSVPMEPIKISHQDQLWVLWSGHITFWLLGLGGIFFVLQQYRKDEMDRQNADQILMESEQRFRAIFEQAAVGVALIRSKTGEYIRVNQRFGDMLGYSVDELQSKTYMDITHPDDLKNQESNLNHFSSGEERGLHLTKRYLHKDGSTVWGSLNRSVLLGKEQEPDQHITIIEDITERKSVEQALRESEDWLQRIADNAPDIIYRFRVHPNIKFEFINKAVSAITGYTPQEFLENPELGTSIFHPDDQEELQDFLEWTLPTNPHAARWYRKDGTEIWVEDIQIPIHDKDGILIAFEGVARDITNRKLAEDELQQLVKQQEALRQASLKLTSNLALGTVLDTILEQAMRLVTADDAHIFLYEMGVIRFGAVRWLDGRSGVPFAEPRQDGLTYTVARSGESLAVPDMSDHYLFSDWPLEGAILGLPLSIGDQVVGVMNIAMDQPYEFSEGELRILELLADQAAIAIENARLHGQAQEHAESLEERVQERTADLEKTINLMAGREVRMAELKKVIKKLRKQLKDMGVTPVANDPLEEPIV